MHIGSLPWYIRGFLRHLEGKLEEGDVIIHNHPYLGASHTPRHRRRGADLLGGRADRLRGRDRPRARRRRLVPRASTPTRSTCTPSRRSTTGCAGTSEGELNEDLDQMIFDNVRTETMNRGDMNAMMAACQLGRDRLLRLVRALRRRDGDERRPTTGWTTRSDAARADREDPGRRVQGADRLARRRRAQPRRAAAGRDEGDRRGRRDHDRPDRLERRGADGLQRPVRGLAAGRRVLRGPHACCSTR